MVRLALAIALAMGPVLAAAAQSNATADEELCLAGNGAAAARIFLPGECRKSVFFAASELSRCLSRMAGTEIPIDYGDPRGRLPAAGMTQIVLEPATNAADDSFTISARPARAGEPARISISGDPDTGLLYGVCHAMWELGARWYAPGEHGEDIPVRRRLVYRAGERTWRPAFRTRVITFSGRSERSFFPEDDLEREHMEYDLWLIRNRCQFDREFHASRAHRFDFNWARDWAGPNLQRAALRGADIRKEPERFALVGAGAERKRVQDRAQVCLSNRQNIEAAALSALEFFDANPGALTYSIARQDCAGFCGCPACAEANGGTDPALDPSLVLWRFADAVAERVRKTRPDRSVAFLTDNESLGRLPEWYRTSNGPVALVSASVTDGLDAEARRGLLRAASAGAQVGFRARAAPALVPQPLAILDVPAACRELGVVWLEIENPGRDEQRCAVDWVLAKLAWDPAQDPFSLLKEYCDGRYGAAGQDAYGVMLALDNACRSVRGLGAGTMGAAQMAMPDALLVRLRSDLAHAANKARGKHKERVRRFADSIEMRARLAEAVRACYAAMQQRTNHARAEALAAADAFTAFWRSNGLDRICSPPIYAAVLDLRTAAAAVEPGTPHPAAPADDLKDADQAALIKAAFGGAAPPADVAAMVLPLNAMFTIDPSDEGDEAGYADPAFDDTGWAEVSTCNHFEPQGFHGYDGVFWYRLKFDAPAFPSGRRLFLRVGGCEGEADFRLNGRVAFNKAAGPSLSFEFEITGLVRTDSENVLAIRGLNMSGPGGLWRPCALYAK